MINEWINPFSNPDELIQYELEEMVMEKANRNDNRQMTLSF